jgi:hypothetical protein
VVVLIWLKGLNLKFDLYCPTLSLGVLPIRKWMSFHYKRSYYVSRTALANSQDVVALLNRRLGCVIRLQ